MTDSQKNTEVSDASSPGEEKRALLLGMLREDSLYDPVKACALIDRWEAEDMEVVVLAKGFGREEVSRHLSQLREENLRAQAEREMERTLVVKRRGSDEEYKNRQLDTMLDGGIPYDGTVARGLIHELFLTERGDLASLADLSRLMKVLEKAMRNRRVEVMDPLTKALKPEHAGEFWDIALKKDSQPMMLTALDDPRFGFLRAYGESDYRKDWLLKRTVGDLSPATLDFVLARMKVEARDRCLGLALQRGDAEIVRVVVERTRGKTSPYLAPLTRPMDLIGGAVKNLSSDIGSLLNGKSEPARQMIRLLAGAGALVGLVSGLLRADGFGILKPELVQGAMGSVTTGAMGMAAGVIGAPAVVLMGMVATFMLTSILVAPVAAIKGVQNARAYARFVRANPAALPPKAEKKKQPKREKKKAHRARKSVVPEVALVVARAAADMAVKADRDTQVMRMTDALRHDHPRALARALAAGAPKDKIIEIGDFRGSPLAYCAEFNLKKCMKALLKEKARTENAGDVKSAIDRAIDKDHPEAIAILAENGAVIRLEHVQRARDRQDDGLANLLESYGELKGTTGDWARLADTARRMEGMERLRVAPAFDAAAGVRVADEPGMEDAPASSRKNVARIEKAGP